MSAGFENPMYSKLSIFVLTILTILSIPGINAVHADETHLLGPLVSYGAARFNNENWYTLPHPKVAIFTMRADGSAYGLTETGVSFVQYNVPNTLGIRVQRFEIDDHYHYIINGEIAESFEDLSIKLATAYQTTQETTS
jgi:hypothetical protein